MRVRTLVYQCGGLETRRAVADALSALTSDCRPHPGSQIQPVAGFNPAAAPRRRLVQRIAAVAGLVLELFRIGETRHEVTEPEFEVPLPDEAKMSDEPTQWTTGCARCPT